MAEGAPKPEFVTEESLEEVPRRSWQIGDKVLLQELVDDRFFFMELMLPRNHESTGYIWTPYHLRLGFLLLNRLGYKVLGMEGIEDKHFRGMGTPALTTGFFVLVEPRT